MVTNPQKGDKIWAIEKCSAYEFEITQPNGEEYLWVKAERKKMGYYDNPAASLAKEFCFPSLDALISDLRERAVALEGGAK